MLCCGRRVGFRVVCTTDSPEKTKMRVPFYKEIIVALIPAFTHSGSFLIIWLLIHLKCSPPPGLSCLTCNPSISVVTSFKDSKKFSMFLKFSVLSTYSSLHPIVDIWEGLCALSLTCCGLQRVGGS